MSKPPYLHWIGLTLSMLVVAAIEARAESIAEMTPSRVIELDSRGQPVPVPVVSSVSLDPTGSLLATAGDDHLVRIWDARQGQMLRQLAAHSDWVLSAVFSPDGRKLATAGHDRLIKLWDVSAGQPLRTMFDSTEMISQLAFSLDGRMLAAAGFDSRVWVYDTQSGRLLWTLDAPGSDIRALVFSPDGSSPRRLAAAGRNGLIRVWEMSGGSRQCDLLPEKGHPRRVHALAYSPDGRLLASGGEEPNIRLWDLTTVGNSDVLPARPGKVLSLVFCGVDRLAAGSSDDVIRVWDLATRSEKSRLVGHTGSVTTLVWDSHSGVLVSGSFDTTVRFWRLGTAGIETISSRY